MDFEHALKDPASEFNSPEAVLNEQSLTQDQKKAVLLQWKQDARRLEETAAEAMAGGEPNLLHSVLKALDQLNDS